MAKKIVSLSALSLTLLSLILGLGSAQALAQKYYKWVDEEGVTHYSVHPPQNAEAEALKIKSTPPSAKEESNSNILDSEGSSEQGKDELEEKAKLSPEELAEIKRKDKENCEIARKNLYTLKNRARVVTIDEKTNEHHYLSEEEKAERLAESEQAIKDFCD